MVGRYRNQSEAKKRPAKSAALVLPSAPSLVFGTLCLLAFRALGVVRDLRPGASGAIALDATWNDWFVRMDWFGWWDPLSRALPFLRRWSPSFCWSYSTTLGLSVIYHPDHLADAGRMVELRRHESVHVRQHEDHGLLGALLGLAIAAWSWEGGLLVWALSPAYSAPCWLGAWLRGGHPYRDAEHERSAYGQVASGRDRPWQG